MVEMVDPVVVEIKKQMEQQTLVVAEVEVLVLVLGLAALVW
jgi:hypothetical protein